MPEIKDTQPGLITRMRARYAEQSANPDVQKARRISVVAISVGVILLGGYRIWHRHGRADDTSFTIGVMPTCASTPVRRLLKQAIDEAPSTKKASALLQRIGAIEETGYVPVGAKGTEVRLCQADTFFNLGRHDVPFTLTWTSPAKDELWIEAEAPF